MFNEGDKIITVGRFGQKCANFKSGKTRFSIPIWSAKVYIAKRNYMGQMKWFFCEHIGRTVASYGPSDKLINETKTECEYPFIMGIRHLDKVNKT